MNKKAQYQGSSNQLGNIQSLTDSLIQEALDGLAAEYGPAWNNMPPEQQMTLARDRVEQFQGLNDAATQAVEHAEQQVGMIGDMANIANKVIFDLSKFGQALMGAEVPMETDPFAQKPTMMFRDAAQVRDYLEQTEDIDSVISEFMRLASDEPVIDDKGEAFNPRQRINDAVKQYIESRGHMNEQDKLRIAMDIFESLPQAAKEEEQSNIGETQLQGVPTVVAESNVEIKKAAESLASKRQAKSFNMRKHAQHKASENLFFFGPGQTRVDPFTGDLVSNYSAYERNKGFGLKVDDALDIDYETIWRSTVMDKYFRPYKDKDGNWTGGYIEKRFEVDRWQPEGNKYQLEPGQRRRAYLPEYRSIEARLQNLRSQTNDSRGREFNNTEKPFDWAADGTSASKFNWKMSSSRSNVKTAGDIDLNRLQQGAPIQPSIDSGELPFTAAQKYIDYWKRNPRMWDSVKRYAAEDASTLAEAMGLTADHGSALGRNIAQAAMGIMQGTGLAASAESKKKVASS